MAAAIPKNILTKVQYCLHAQAEFGTIPRKKRIYEETNMERLLNTIAWPGIALLLLCFVSTAQAKTICVDANAPGANNGSSWVDAYNHLQDALSDAHASEKPVDIRVAQGTYTPDTNSAVADGSGSREATFRLVSGVTLKGGYAGSGALDPGARDIDAYETVLSGDLNGNDGPDLAGNSENTYHVVTGTGTDDSAVIEGFTITGGNASSYPNYKGGGVYDDGAGITMTCCTLKNNSAEYRGGGMYCSGSPVITDCVFSKNSAANGGGGVGNCGGSPMYGSCIFKENSGGAGGAVFNTSTHPTFVNCTFHRNSAGYGGGIFDYDSSARSTLVGCTFTENSAGAGGAIQLEGRSTIEDCTFTGNSGTNGGALRTTGARSGATILNCTFLANSASRGGGLNAFMCTSNDPPLTFSNCLFVGNTATVRGGGIYTESSMLHLVNCTLAGNSTDGTGGGMENWGPSNWPQLHNCLLWANKDQSGTSESSQFNKRNSSPNINYCCIQGWSGSLGGVGNFGTNPLLFPDNYHLKPSSPCVDRGDANRDYSGQTDIDGQTRVNNNRVDIGADEFYPQTPMIAVSPAELDLSCPRGGPSPTPVVLSVRNCLLGSLNWQVTADCNWLNLSPICGQSTGEIDEVILTIDANDLAPNMYRCILTVFDPNAVNTPKCVPISLDVRPPRIVVDVNQLDFACAYKGPGPDPQIIAISNDDLGILNWRISKDCPWLEVLPVAGSSAGERQEVLVAVDANRLDPGAYTCSLAISDPNAGNTPQQVTVNLAVRIPRIAVEPNHLHFASGSRGPTPEPQTFSIWNSDLGTLDWNITEDCNWLEVRPISGSSSGEPNQVVVTVDANGMDWRQYTCELLISDPNASNTPQYLAVSLDVRRPVIALDPVAFDFYCPGSDANCQSQTLSIWNQEVGQLDWEMTADCNWLSIDANHGSSTGNPEGVSITPNMSGLNVGTYDCTLTITDLDANNNPRIVPVSLHVLGDTVHVPREFATIQLGIDHAALGGTVIVDPGIYTGPGNRNIDFNGKAITVRSTDPNDPNIVAATVIDCNGLGRGFYFHTDEDANSVLSGFTITNGYAKYGGGIYCAYSGPSIYNCVMVGNTAYGYPGGGGICGNEDDAAITDCTIVCNTTPELGGGVYLGRSKAQVVGCRISGNSAGRDGGGVYTSHGWSDIRNCLIVGNRASEAGGAICNWGRSPTIESSTICHNVALGFAGGIISTYGSKTSVLNSIVCGNSAHSGPELVVAADDGVESTLSVSYSNVNGGRNMVSVAEGCTLNWGSGNIDIDPCFVDPGYWAHKDDPNIHLNPDDPNATWVDGDYHLKSQHGRWAATERRWMINDVTSLSIDAGDPNSDWTRELWPNGKRINLGAYGGTGEASMSPNDVGNIADFDLDGFVYSTDLPLFISQWLLGGQPLAGDLTRDGFVDFPDFAAFGWHWKRPSPPLPANDPCPTDGASGVALAPLLTWISDANALWHDVYFGTTSPGIFQICQPNTTFEPGLLDKNTWYYWRIDEMNPGGATAGAVWSFKTGSPPDPATEPNPPYGSVGIRTDPVLSWVAGAGATSHDVYFGKTSPGTFRGNQNQTTFTPGSLAYETTYYWRIDEVNAAARTRGPVWSFTTKSSGTR